MSSTGELRTFLAVGTVSFLNVALSSAEIGCKWLMRIANAASKRKYPGCVFVCVHVYHSTAVTEDEGTLAEQSVIAKLFMLRGYVRYLLYSCSMLAYVAVSILA